MIAIKSFLEKELDIEETHLSPMGRIITRDAYLLKHMRSSTCHILIVRHISFNENFKRQYVVLDLEKRLN